MKALPLADTPLAHWLNQSMARWENPDTGMLGMSQNELRKRSGISQAQLHDMLKREHTPTPDTLNRLAEFFGANPITLYRIVYVHDDVDPEVKAGMASIESMLDRMPPGVRAHFLESLVPQAEMIIAAVDHWEEVNEVG
ncbi:helix-turn-helix domain-containing protein [Chloroflexota bacterium]